MAEEIKIIECPRDAMQGIKTWIPTEDKIRYINQLLKVGFDTIDFGSCVSEKAVPQMKDTAEVLRRLDLTNATSRLLAIVANERGAESACQFDEIHYLGYPFSISETFQQRNTNASIDQSVKRVEAIQQLCLNHKKELIIYISMGFGNPYGDPWNPEIVYSWSSKLHHDIGIRTLALSDTVGAATPEIVTSIFSSIIPALPRVEFGAHLHSTVESCNEKLEAAFKAGCRRFDGAIKGFGGCPMAEDELTGNMPTEKMLDYFKNVGIPVNLNETEFQEAMVIASRIFPIV